MATLSAYDRYFSLSYDESEDQHKVRRETLDNSQALGKFLASIERRAFRRAQIATGNREEALDIVQDAMYSLVNKYSGKAPAEWELLFHRILSRRIIDWYRQSQIRKRFGVWLSSDDESEAVNETEDVQGRSPEQLLQTGQAVTRLEALLKELPLKQQQVFLLRAWEGLSEKETAKAMTCSVGTVKTHYSRARTFLKSKMQDE